MGNIKTKRKGQAALTLYAVLTLFLIVIFVIFGLQKQGYNVDEIYTFGLANHNYDSNGSINPTFTDGQTYSGEELWQGYVTVQAGSRFDYANVFKNQSNDVHPPLYYLFVHTLCSLFPTLPVSAVGLGLNVVFACVAFWQFVWIAQALGARKGAALFLSLCFVLGNEFVNSDIIFFRMYTLFTIWANFLAIVFLKWKPRDQCSWRYCLALGGTLLAGMMTQYYFLIFAFLACLVYAVLVILHQNWVKLGLSVVVSLAAIGLGFLIFPAAWFHLFKSYRGTEAMENAATSSFQQQVWGYLQRMNVSVFGGLFALLLAVLFCLLIVSSGRQKTAPRVSNPEAYLTLAIPACLYVLIITKIAPYQSGRYVIAVMGLGYLALFVFLTNMAGNWSRKGERYVLLLAGLTLICSYQKDLEYLYPEEADYVAQIQQHSDAQCVYLYTDSWKALSNYKELRPLQNIVFLRPESWEQQKGTDYGSDSMIVFITNNSEFDAQADLNILMESNGYSTSQEMFTSGYATAYYLE